jgi:hypothetical protein
LIPSLAVAWYGQAFLEPCDVADIVGEESAVLALPRRANVVKGWVRA